MSCTSHDHIYQHDTIASYQVYDNLLAMHSDRDIFSRASSAILCIWFLVSMSPSILHPFCLSPLSRPRLIPSERCTAQLPLDRGACRRPCLFAILTGRHPPSLRPEIPVCTGCYSYFLCNLHGCLCVSTLYFYLPNRRLFLSRCACLFPDLTGSFLDD